jgi:predicted nucleic acid-binding protein
LTSAPQPNIAAADRRRTDVLLDTSVLIDLQRAHPPALAWLNKNSNLPFSVSSVSVLELSVGAETKDEVRNVRALLDATTVIAVDDAIAWRAGELFRKYNRSHGTGRIDALIAATALITRAPLATHNVKHFPMIKGLRPPY